MKKYSDVIEVMEKFGGGFVKALSIAYGRADIKNARKLEEAFSELFESYYKFLK